MSDIILPDIGTIVEIETGGGSWFDMPHTTEKHIGILQEAKQNEEYSMFLSFTLSCRRPDENVHSRWSRKRPLTYDYVREDSECLILVPGKLITEEEVFDQPPGMKILLQYNFMQEVPEEGYLKDTASVEVVGYLKGQGFLGGIKLARTNVITCQKLSNIHSYPLKNSSLPPPLIFLLEEKQ